VITKTTAKPPLHQRAVHELKELVFISLYLYITIGAVILMKTAVLRTEGIEFTPWGIAIVKAVLLAKFMLLGEAMRIGGRSTTAPLIWPTLQKAFGLLVLLIIMTIIEEAVVGLFHHQSIAAFGSTGGAFVICGATRSRRSPGSPRRECKRRLLPSPLFSSSSACSPSSRSCGASPSQTGRLTETNKHFRNHPTNERRSRWLDPEQVPNRTSS
jgi:hypothetical protein